MHLSGERSSNWPLWAIQRVMEGACRALVYLHSHRPPIMHRGLHYMDDEGGRRVTTVPLLDLKSPNLLLDDSLNVKVCDFGLAKLRECNRVMTANVGTLQVSNVV